MKETEEGVCLWLKGDEAMHRRVRSRGGGECQSS